MKMIMTLINPVLQAVNQAVNGLQENAWPICLLLALGWFVKTQGRCRCLSGRCAGAVCHGDQRTDKTNALSHAHACRRISHTCPIAQSLVPVLPPVWKPLIASASAHRLSAEPPRKGWRMPSFGSSRASQKAQQREEEVRRVRLLQQEKAAVAARAATARQATAPSAAVKPKKKKATEGKRRPNEGYNPMQPWSANAGSGGYRYVT
jgi:hypothetical protein